MSREPIRTASPRPRPLSPHLTAYRWPITMVMSIAHRVTGAALYFGILLVAWWLAATASSPEQFAAMSAVLSSWFGLLVLFGYTFVLVHHMLGGIRHLVWDTIHGLEKQNSKKMAWATVAGSTLLTLLIWGVGLALRT